VLKNGYLRRQPIVKIEFDRVRQLPIVMVDNMGHGINARGVLNGVRRIMGTLDRGLRCLLPLLAMVCTAREEQVSDLAQESPSGDSRFGDCSPLTRQASKARKSG
jgi:hypothetical protein